MTNITSQTMDNYKATPEQWECQERWASSPVLGVDSSCFLELRARVAKLEAQANHFVDVPKMVPPPVATDEELSDTWHKGSLTPDGRYMIGRKGWRAVYNLGVAHGQAGSREVAEPVPIAGGLVERVKLAIDSAPFDEDEHQWDEARAAILEVARWLRENECCYNAVRWLEQEAGR